MIRRTAIVLGGFTAGLIVEPGLCWSPSPISSANYRRGGRR